MYPMQFKFNNKKLLKILFGTLIIISLLDTAHVLFLSVIADSLSTIPRLGRVVLTSDNTPPFPVKGDKS